MSDPTSLIVSIQGKRGSGKSRLAELAIEPALAAIGAKIENKRDVQSGVFLTVTLPFGAVGRVAPPLMFNVLAPPPPDEALPQMDRQGRLIAGPRVGLANAGRVIELYRKRGELLMYADDKSDMAATVARMSLPNSLRDVMEPEAVIALLRELATRALAQVDGELAALGFDLTAPE